MYSRIHYFTAAFVVIPFHTDDLLVCITPAIVTAIFHYAATSYVQ